MFLGAFSVNARGPGWPAVKPEHEEIHMDVSSVGSGMPSLQQMRQFQQQAFSKADANGDGGLTIDEFKSIGQSLPGGKSLPAGAPDAETAFGKIDTDKNGSVTQQELESFKPAFDPQTANSMLQAQQTGTKEQGGLLDYLLNTLNESKKEKSSNNAKSNSGNSEDSTSTSSSSSSDNSIVKKLVDAYTTTSGSGSSSGQLALA
jgi:Ca2+-binding EF-hand superfamily protein